MSEIAFEAGGLSLVMRAVQQDELVQVRAFCQRLQWDVSLQDIQVMFNAKPKAFIGAFLKGTSQLISFVIAMPLYNNLAYIGLFITAKEHRNKGIGKVVFNKALDDLKGYNILIESVPDRRGMYQKFGFSNSEQIVFRIEGYIQALPSYEGPDMINIKKVNEENVGKVMIYDRSISLIDRSDHLPLWLSTEGGMALAAFQNGQCVGFGAVRKYEDVYKIQPLYAESSEIACALMQEFVTSGTVPAGSKVRFFPVVQNKVHVVSVAEKFGITDVLPPNDYRLHFVQEVKFPWKKIFSTTNLQNTII